MQKTILTFGIISGLIVIILWFATWSLMTGENGEMDMSKGELFGYINMIIALSMVFFGIRQYRERYLGGKITFKKAFVVGFLISLIASAMYMISWMVYWHTSDVAQTFPVQYLNHLKEQWTAAGMSAEEINTKSAEFQKTMEMYSHNLLIMAGMTLMEILPVGLIISLISALILKKK